MNGSDTTLNAKAANGASSLDSTAISAPVESTPFVSAMSSGHGK